jgi:hypothetical protein
MRPETTVPVVEIDDEPSAENGQQEKLGLDDNRTGPGTGGEETEIILSFVAFGIEGRTGADQHETVRGVKIPTLLGSVAVACNSDFHVSNISVDLVDDAGRRS